MLLCLMIVKQSVLLLIVLNNIKLLEKNDMLAITLWRSVGKLSKQDRDWHQVIHFKFLISKCMG